MLKLMLQYFGHLLQRTDSLEKTLMLGKIEGRRRRGQQRMRWLDGITNLMYISLSKLGSWLWTGKPGVLQSMGSQRVRHNWATEQQQSLVTEITLPLPSWSFATPAPGTPCLRGASGSTWHTELSLSHPSHHLPVSLCCYLHTPFTTWTSLIFSKYTTLLHILPPLDTPHPQASNTLV